MASAPGISAAENAPAHNPRLVTLAQVAQVAGVATSTASAVLSGKGYCYASQKTRQRILEAAEKMHYRPNTLSRGLQGLPTQKIGVLLAMIGPTTVAIENLRAIETASWQNDYRLLFGAHHGEAAREDEYLLAFESDRVDGLIVTPSHDDSRQHALLGEWARRGVPMVTLDSLLDLPVPDVAVDREQGGYLQIKHLLDLGRRRPAFLLTAHESPVGKPKVAGIRRALREAGLDLDALPQVAHTGRVGGQGSAYGAKMTRALLAGGDKFDALVTLSDSVAVGAMQVLLQAGLAIPDDVAVVGFDDEPYAAYLPIPLTTVRQPQGEVGQRAFALLLEQLQDRQKKRTRQRIRLQPQLLARRSTTGVDAVEDSASPA